MLSIILLVLFVMTMFLWLLSMLGAVRDPASQVASYSPWLGWFSCLFLGLALFVSNPIVTKWVVP